ncbi:MAG: hypothetical protein R3A80_07720 [Bdellovibrionota bacterium]
MAGNNKKNIKISLNFGGGGPDLVKAQELTVAIGRMVAWRKNRFCAWIGGQLLYHSKKI